MTHGGTHPQQRPTEPIDETAGSDVGPPDSSDPGAAVVRTVAAAEGVDPFELDGYLQDAVDTGALETLVTHESDRWRLDFEFAGHDVAVSGDGTVVVDGRAFPGVLDA
ncbi:HalOD1 output domain-containing protein [Halobaculum sp. EA56]|uniref:HalOD1 output domain-containing protein n=1 Tax=Halobaculum sp. EA56 TaxID=3421648 RepID=UPI003EB7930B